MEPHDCVVQGKNISTKWELPVIWLHLRRSLAYEQYQYRKPAPAVRLQSRACPAPPTDAAHPTPNRTPIATFHTVPIPLAHALKRVLDKLCWAIFRCSRAVGQVLSGRHRSQLHNRNLHSQILPTRTHNSALISYHMFQNLMNSSNEQIRSTEGLRVGTCCSQVPAATALSRDGKGRGEEGEVSDSRKTVR